MARKYFPRTTAGVRAQARCAEESPALRELGAEYERLVGVSGGSIVAALHAAGWTPDRMLDLGFVHEIKRIIGTSKITADVNSSGIFTGVTTSKIGHDTVRISFAIVTGRAEIRSPFDNITSGFDGSIDV